MVVKRDSQLIKNNFFAVVHCFKTWRHYVGLHKKKIHEDNVPFKYSEIEAQPSAKPLQWHDTLGLMKEDSITNRVSYWGPLCGHCVTGTPHGKMRDNYNAILGMMFS